MKDLTEMGDLEKPDEEAAEPVSDTEQKLSEMTEKYETYLDKYERLFAEFDNYRKRTDKEKAKMFDLGVRETVLKLLPVADNLERAIDVDKDKESPLYKGVEMTLKSLMLIFEGLQVTQIKALGEKFDPDVHNAVSHEEDETKGENEVVMELLRGYKYKDNVIRHSMVKVVN